MTHAEFAQRREAIAAALANGQSADEVARGFGCHIRTVRTVGREYGLSVSRTNVLDIVARLLRPGGSVQEIARELGVCRQRVQQVQSDGRRLGIAWPVRTRG